MIGTKVNLGIMIAGLLLLSCGGDNGTGGGEDRLHPAVAEITAPEDGASYEEGDTVSFAGTATDVEDGTLTDTALVWTSDKDGILGSGNALHRADLSINTHQIVLTAIDSDDSTGSDTITIHITAKPEPDTTAPATITDLAVDSTTPGAVYFSWTAPGDDGNTGTATHYDIRYSTAPLTDEAAWDTARMSVNEPVPLIAGTPQSHRIAGLESETLYYVSMKTTDEEGNWSARANEISGRTKEMGPIGGKYEPNDDTAHATTIEHEETQIHSLDPIQDVDWFTFTTTEETTLLFSYTATGYAAAGPAIELYNEGGIRMRGLSQCAPSGCDARRLSLPGDLPAGRYYIVVSPTGGYLIDNYVVKLDVTPAGTGHD